MVREVYDLRERRKKMRTLLFIVFKIVEITAIIYLPYLMGCLMEKFNIIEEDCVLGKWGIGLLGLIALGLIGFALTILCQGNWILVDQIIK